MLPVVRRIVLVGVGSSSEGRTGMCCRGQPGWRRRPIKRLVAVLVVVVALLGSGAVIAGRGVPETVVIGLVLVLLVNGELVQRQQHAGNQRVAGDVAGRQRQVVRIALLRRLRHTAR